HGAAVMPCSPRWPPVSRRDFRTRRDPHVFAPGCPLLFVAIAPHILADYQHAELLPRERPSASGDAAPSGAWIFENASGAVRAGIVMPGCRAASAGPGKGTRGLFPHAHAAVTGGAATTRMTRPGAPW